MVETYMADFRASQRAFTAHLRDPEQYPAPAAIEDRRMAIYRDLIFNNVESLLAGNFPVLRKLLPDERWKSLVRGFFIHHRAQTPLFTELAQEFIAYLHGRPDADPADPPFLLELAHYEWVELALLISEATPDLSRIDPNGSLLAGAPMVSPLAWPLTYKFPVHRIGPDYQPTAPPPVPTYLVAYRNRSEQVEFMETNAVTQRLLQLLQETPDSTGQVQLKRIAAELNHPAPEQILDFGAQLLDDLRALGIILGVHRTAP